MNCFVYISVWAFSNPFTFESCSINDLFLYSLREHSFFRGIDFDRLPDSTPSTLAPFLPALQSNGEPEPDACWSRIPANSRVKI